MQKSESFIEPIGYSQAAKYLKDMAGSPVFSEMDGYISGIFEAKTLKKWVSEKNVKGIVFWFCNMSSSKKPILAIQKIREDYQDNPGWLSDFFPNRPVVHNRGLRIVKNVIQKKFTKNAHVDEILNDIKNEPPVEPKDFDFRDSGSVDEMRRNFTSNFSSHVKYPFAYFSTKEGDGSPYFELFFKQGDVSFIRYYLGYSEDSFFNGQKVRLILAPSKADGSPLQKEECTKKHFDQFGEAILLQYSWPPKPQNLT